LEDIMQYVSSVLRHLVVPLAVAGAFGGSFFAAERPAAAQVVYVTPPMPRVEVVPPIPVPGMIWMPGYWGWRHGYGYAWNGGRWGYGRPGYAWHAPAWRGNGRAWRFAPGHWGRGRR
jgi:hypothetical protein